MTMLYLVKVSKTWFAYPATIGNRMISKAQAAQNWMAGYPECADTILVIDAPAADADGKPFQIAWGWSYRLTARGYEVHARGRSTDH